MKRFNYELSPNSILNQTYLNDRQRDAVTTTEGPLMVLAGAGSGKTKMLVSRICYLIQERHVLPYQVLAVTFTNKAAGEMRERVQKMLSLPPGMLPEIKTFHSFCIRVLRQEFVHLPFTKPFVIYDDADQTSLIKAVLNVLQIDDKALSPQYIQSRINSFKCDAIEPNELPTDSGYARQLQRIYEQYQKELFLNCGLDFGEIICMTYRLFRDQPQIREKYQKRFRYIHVDEYQDTNRSQYLLLSMLTSPKFNGHQNICVVGDEDQSIYKWRGADIRNILDFESEYPGCKTIKLEQNYRSSQSILKAAGAVIVNNKSRKDKTLWTENEEGCPVYRVQLPDERAEAEMVVSEIKRIARDNAHPRGYDSFAIFYRTNAQSRQFEDLFRREKIPYQIFGGLKFYDRKEIKDILSYFKVILNPADSISLKRIINTPARGIGKTTVDKLEQSYRDANRNSPITLLENIEQVAQAGNLLSAAASKKLLVFTQLIQRLVAQQPKLLLSELYHLILDETGYVIQLKQENTDESLSRIENLEEFNTLLQEFEEDQLGGLPEAEVVLKKSELLSLFVEQSALASEVAPPPAGQTPSNESTHGSVRLMTLHSSKGLEFPVVFMVGMEEGLFPSIKPWQETDDGDIEEERRLCYVGMTRAREILYLINVLMRRIWGKTSYQEPSRFFSEIPEETLEFKDFSYGVQAREYQPESSRSFSFRNQVEMGEWIGKRIDHPDYGQGTIISSDGAGSDQKVTIQFLRNQQRKFLLRYILNYFE